MLFAPTLADKAILPRAWGGRYFFNRIGLSLTAALFNADGTPLLFSRRGVMPRQE
ncbi:hypothetical protein JTM09_32520 [Pseudomonas aeruginosa]|nr:hypothetical protein [Pseudomonas aeruginosa]MBN0386293.1 hypothetical protein [Pseudomonas aeruginosa]MBN0682912.1 hypothetical protein [Pseudomonas aeruginosa]MBN0697853.1 hypothetical protein [Pseudomonas aeruginosa]MBN0795540.1 hypothetical protein [Pseudomonas aeruginosa]